MTTETLKELTLDELSAAVKLRTMQRDAAYLLTAVIGPVERLTGQPVTDVDYEEGSGEYDDQGQSLYALERLTLNLGDGRGVTVGPDVTFEGDEIADPQADGWPTLDSLDIGLPGLGDLAQHAGTLDGESIAVTVLRGLEAPAPARVYASLPPADDTGRGSRLAVLYRATLLGGNTAHSVAEARKFAADWYGPACVHLEVTGESATEYDDEGGGEEYGSRAVCGLDQTGQVLEELMPAGGEGVKETYWEVLRRTKRSGQPAPQPAPLAYHDENGEESEISLRFTLWRGQLSEGLYYWGNADTDPFPTERAILHLMGIEAA